MPDQYPNPSSLNYHESLNALASRMGKAAFGRRMEKEKALLDKMGKVHAHGIFRLENYLNLYACIGLGLKASLLWKRAKRNYFNIQTVRQEVYFKDLPPEFDGYTVLQLADLHADLHPDFPNAVIEAIASLNYDCAVVTGDYRTCTYSDVSSATEASIRVLQQLKAPCYAILGNHDFLCKVPAFEASGILFLLNEHILLKKDGAEIALIGIDDPNHYKSHDISRALAGVEENVFKLLLSHSPQTYIEAESRGIHYLLAGHTHGGQICLPGGRVIVHDYSSPRRLLSGPWRYGRLKGYTSRGTGATGLPVRLNCMPEVTLHVLRRSTV